MSPTKSYHVTNHIVDVIIWPKFSNSSIYVEEVNIISILKGSDQKKQILKGRLGSSSIIWDGHYLWPWNLYQCGKRVKIKSQKVLEANSNVCRSYMEKLVGGSFLPPKSWIWLNELKWEDFFELNCRRLCHLTICT